MPEFFYGAATYRQSFSGSGNITTDDIPLPAGRTMVNGRRDIYVYELSAWASSKGAVRSGRFYLNQGAAAAYTNVLNLPIETQANNRGFQACVQDAYMVAGPGRLRLAFGGEIYYAYGGGGATNDGGGIIRSGALAMGMRYQQAPAAPTMLSVAPSSDGKSATVRFQGSADNGGSNITGWKLQWATNSAFTTGVGTIGSTGTSTVTGLVPGTTYWWRAAGRNGVTDNFSTTGPWSAPMTMTQPDPLSFGKMRNSLNNAWVPTAGRIRSADNTAWLELDGRIRNASNTAWDEIGS